MWSPFWKLSAVAPFLIFFFLPVSAERMMRPGTPGTNPPGPLNPAHRHPLIRNSGYIFAGTVKSVERAAPKGNGVATVLINFHVDEGIRGARTGQTLAIREWAGLWEWGQRYRPGERVLLFLYPPSKLGLTSPVAGPMGRFRIGPDGRIVVDPGRFGFPTRHPHTGNRFWEKTRFSPRDFVRFIHMEEE